MLRGDRATSIPTFPSLGEEANTEFFAKFMLSAHAGIRRFVRSGKRRNQNDSPQSLRRAAKNLSAGTTE